MHPEEAIILQFLRCLGNVTSWNIRLLRRREIFLTVGNYLAPGRNKQLRKRQ